MLDARCRVLSSRGPTAMQPISDLLHRIRWDPEFGRGSFAIGYWDRVARREQVVPFGSVAFDPGNPGLLLIHGEDALTLHVPLHRVRTVYKDGLAIWRRHGPTDAGGDD
jgi:uncharacterized protein (UPF0248 family)